MRQKHHSFRDFMYDHNDVLIALIILLVAAFVIVWRVQIIMTYPDTLVSGSSATTQSSAISSDKDIEASGNTSAGSAETTTGEKITKAEWDDNDKLAKDIDVKIADGTATASVESLVQAGIFKSYSEYQEVCSSQNIDPTSINAGTYTFTTGQTKATIVKQVTAARH